mmetsp:Transcript_51617/g.131376  ORF Transcript_51617/g.131376 Transcript_51617/m.131376 type:complete len:272 (-) Transcript_51617:424-1239(-)
MASLRRAAVAAWVARSSAATSARPGASPSSALRCSSASRLISNTARRAARSANSLHGPWPERPPANKPRRFLDVLSCKSTQASVSSFAGKGPSSGGSRPPQASTVPAMAATASRASCRSASAKLRARGRVGPLPPPSAVASSSTCKCRFAAAGHTLESSSRTKLVQFVEKASLKPCCVWPAKYGFSGSSKWTPSSRPYSCQLCICFSISSLALLPNPSSCPGPTVSLLSSSPPPPQPSAPRCSPWTRWSRARFKIRIWNSNLSGSLKMFRL